MLSLNGGIHLFQHLHPLRCDLKMGAEWGLWFAPMIISVLINIIFYFLILRTVQSRRANAISSTFASRRKMENNAVKKISFYLLAFVICWIWDIIGHIVTSVNPHCKGNEFLYFL